MKNKINAIETSANLMYKFSIKKATADKEMINKEMVFDLFIGFDYVLNDLLTQKDCYQN